MWTATTSPNVSQESTESPSAVCSRMHCVSRHSKATGLSITRGTPTTRESAGVKPDSTNSSTYGDTAALVWFIASANGRVAKFQTNSPVSWMLRTVSL